MTDRTDALAQAVFQKPSLQSCSLQQVDYLAHQYPYFTAAQLLLLQKTEPGSEDYRQLLHHVALHVSNPLQFQTWLQPDGFGLQHAQPQLFQTPIPDEVGIERNAEPETEAPEIADVPEETEETVPDFAEVETESERLEEARNEETAVATPEVEVEASNEPGDTAEEASAESVETTTSAPPLTAAPATAPETPAITFEPYHTVDYFASQGIRLSQQEAGSDKLGKQLKSFTEWLRTMKRLPDTAVALPGDATTEHNVENLAAHSLDTADVVTESMAEVWLKQGNREKAADVYRKLSLHYPAKSAYFAAKIEALKQS
jgi:hypothetical protein